MARRTPPFLIALAAAGSVAGLLACGSGEPSPPATDVGARGAPAASSAVVPRTPQALSARLLAADVALRRGIHAWRADVRQARSAPPHEVAAQARYVKRAVRLLSGHPRLAAATIRRLPAGLAHQTRELTAAQRDLRRLSAGWPAQPARKGRPQPLGRLLGYYRAADRRFGVDWQVLAALNLVESAFGRFRNHSVAGAQGPMQFMPATWRVYGLGGAIRDPHDAILGAANLLRHAGAPESYARALYAYNPSPLYVDAVRRYAGLIARDRDAVYFLYSW